MVSRILFSIILLWSLLFLPFWLSYFLLILGIFFFHHFWEGVVLFLISDLIYGVKEQSFFNIVFISTILSSISLLGLELLKRNLKIYSGK
ncbi:hypothetical protein HZA26_03435 [Candidatus Nomurabacteria bacterium]|nr:hypothetical protein [Candidatus Nomurabacteria bacterium]